VASYTVGCFTKHWNLFWVLFMGRVFCGVATSLLYSRLSPGCCGALQGAARRATRPEAESIGRRARATVC